MDIVLKRIIEKEEKGKELYRILWSKNISQKYNTIDHMSLCISYKCFIKLNKSLIHILIQDSLCFFLGNMDNQQYHNYPSFKHSWWI